MLIQFQFHSGSIKSNHNRGMTNLVMMFQFHSGSIKSHERNVARAIKFLGFNSIVVRLKVGMRAWCNWQHASFNSIVVRLKESGTYEGTPGQTSFNSIVVRLKDHRFCGSSSSSSLFQFHSGSIKRAMMWTMTTG